MRGRRACGVCLSLACSFNDCQFHLLSGQCHDFMKGHFTGQFEGLCIAHVNIFAAQKI